MQHLSKLLQTFAIAMMPVAAFAHPGHFDGSPIAHALSHCVAYLLIALGTIVIPINGFVTLRAMLRNRRDAQSSQVCADMTA